MLLFVQARDTEREAEQKRIRKEKEMEIAKLRAQQEKDRNYKAEQVRNCFWSFNLITGGLIWLLTVLGHLCWSFCGF